jgi:Putative adhesin
MKLAFLRGTAALWAALWLMPSVAPASPVEAEQRETEVVDRSFPFNPDGRLELRNFSGKITITGSNRANVVVHAVRRATRERLEGIRLEIDATPSEISIEANKKTDRWEDRDNNVVDTEFEIEVPQRTTLDVHAFSSDVRITGVEGKQKLHTFSGEIRVDEAAGPLDIETFSGDIEVDLATTASGRVDFDSFSGSLDTDMPMTYRTGSKRHISGDIGTGGGSNTFHFKTFSGDVRIK